MKKTLIALMALAGVACAFDDTTWSFDNTLAGTGGHSVAASNVAYGSGTTWSATAVYEESGLTAGIKVGNYYLSADLGQAVTLSGGKYIRLSDKYWTNQAGKIGLEAQYRDVDGNGSLDKDTGNPYTNSYTLMAWVKFDDTSGKTLSQAIFGTGESNGNGMAFSLMDNKYIDLCAKNVADNKTGELTIASDTWYNFAVTYNSSTKKAVYYLNGEQVHTQTVENYNYAGDKFSAIGAKYYTTGDAKDVMTGAIAEFKILNGAYTQAQILEAAHLTTIPEPATATLSLLALAGLCARRRRA